MKKVLMASLVSSLFVLAICLVLPLSAYSADKLVVKDAGGTNTVFVVTDVGKVGIDTATPTAKIQVGTVNPPDIGTPWDFYSYNPSFGRIAIDSGVNNAGIEFLEGTNRKWFVGSFNGLFGIYNTPNSAFRMVINPSGNVGIGTSTPAYRLDVNGQARINGIVYGSSRSLKNNITDLHASEALEALKGLNPVLYNYKADENEKHVGFIAEDVPDLVAKNGRTGIDPMDIVGVLTKVVQEQQKTISELAEKVSNLQREVKLKGNLASN